MIQTARFPVMDANLAAPKRPEYQDDSSQGSGGMQQSPTPGYLQGQSLVQQDAHRRMQSLTLNTAEGRARKRFQRTTSENEDPLRKPGFSVPFGRQSSATQSAEQKMPQHARRRSTLRDNKAPLLGPRPLQNNRCVSIFEFLHFGVLTVPPESRASPMSLPNAHRTCPHPQANTP
jgi:hypothetical protein